MTNQEKAFMLLEQLKTLESRIESASVMAIKPLVKEAAKKQRQFNAVIAMEVFANG